MAARRLDEAIDAYRRAVAIEPGLHAANKNLGMACELRGLRDEALHSYAAAMTYASAVPGALENYSGRYQACVLSYQAHLFQLHRASRADQATVFAQHRHFGQLIESHLRRREVQFANRPDPERRLRIGYLSPDFRLHSVAHFIEPVITHHDRGQVEVFCYYSCPESDAVTRRIASTCDHWLDAAHWNNEALAARIRADAIDILVDLAGHTVGNRLRVLALKPAPIQVAYLGYPVTMGLSAIEHRIDDPHTHAHGASAQWFVERSLLLPTSMLVYRPHFGPGGLLGENPMPSTDPPILRRGYPTFGSFNDLSKYSDDCVASWARLLLAVPGSRLLLKSRGFDSASTRQALLETFNRLKVDSARVDLAGLNDDPAAHLARYAEIDVSLDTFPYNGVTTSLESIWMGVPLVTLPGDAPASRMGLSIATNAGHPEWIAHSPDDYIAIAAALVADAAALGRLRQSLPAQLQASPLMDGAGFARRIEAAYRAVWSEWCCRQAG